MIQLFLKYNPVKLFLAFVVLLVIRGAAYQIGLPVTDPELTWLLVGERMSDGFTLYKDIWTDLEPFSAGTYFILDLIFGKSTTVYFVLSLLLVALQAMIFNFGMNQNKVFREPSSLPAFFYVLFSSLYFDFYTLSPVLLGMTFLLPAFSMICTQARTTGGEDRYFYIGIFCGIASLFYLPYAMFLLFALVSLALYAISSFKKQILLVLAFGFPYILVLIYYFWIDNLGNYYKYGVFPALNAPREFLIDIPTIVKIIVLPSLLLLAAMGAIAARGKYIHYQYKIIKIAGIWVLTGVIALFLEKSISSPLFIMFIPAFVFFTSHLFIIFSKGRLFREGFFLIMFGGIFLISFYSLKKPDNYTREHLIKTVPHEMDSLAIKGKALLVLGNQKEYYINNRLSGQYENWDLSKWQFSNLKKYENLSAIYETIERNKPEYIVDKNDLMKELQVLIPVLQQQYQKIGRTNIYQRKG